MFYGVVKRPPASLPAAARYQAGGYFREQPRVAVFLE